MDFENYLHMDPHLLAGLLNTAIRNKHGSLEELCAAHGLERDSVVARMSEAGYDFQPTQEQFR